MITTLHSKPTISKNNVIDICKMLSTELLQMGKKTEALKILKDKFQLDNFYFTQSGSHALYWILKGLALQPYDEVILPTYVCKSVYQAVVAVGAKPILCDIGRFWLMDRKHVENSITPQTKVIVPVGLFGIRIDCEQFRHRNIFIINDLCQSFYSLKLSKKDYGDFLFTSFHPTKYITAGSGGGVAVLNEKIPFENLLADRLLGNEWCDLNMFLLIDQLLRIEEFFEKRQKIAKYYFKNLPPSLTQYTPQENNCFYRFPIIQDRYSFDYIQEYFNKKNIHVRRGVDRLIHRIIGLEDELYPNAIESYEKTISLPIYPSLKKSEYQRISHILCELFDE